MTRGEVPLKPLYYHTRSNIVRTITALVAITAMRKKKQSEQLDGPFCYGCMVIIMKVVIFYPIV